jgi:hypothetical protein
MVPIVRIVTALFSLALAGLIGPAAAEASDITPASGSYLARGEGDPARYGVRATVQRKGASTYISVRVSDSCGGFATFPAVRVGRSRRGVPIFAAQVGGVRVSGHWVGPTRIDGSVRTPCAGAERYALRLA